LGTYLSCEDYDKRCRKVMCGDLMVRERKWGSYPYSVQTNTAHRDKHVRPYVSDQPKESVKLFHDFRRELWFVSRTISDTSFVSLDPAICFLMRRIVSLLTKVA
jgi:hypothetical protein